MSSKYYPYLWYLAHIDKCIIKTNDYHPYLDLYLQSDTVYINTNCLEYDLLELNDSLVINSYIKIISKIQNSFLTNRLDILSKNKNYLIEKYKFKKKINKDIIYILKKAITKEFKSNVIYLDRENKMFLIFLDYENTKSNRILIETILDELIPICFTYKYTFEHMYKLDREEFKKLERWLLL